MEEFFQALGGIGPIILLVVGVLAGVIASHGRGITISGIKRIRCDEQPR